MLTSVNYDLFISIPLYTKSPQILYGLNLLLHILD